MRVRFPVGIGDYLWFLLPEKAVQFGKISVRSEIDIAVESVPDIKFNGSEMFRNLCATN